MVTGRKGLLTQYCILLFLEGFSDGTSLRVHAVKDERKLSVTWDQHKRCQETPGCLKP